MCRNPKEASATDPLTLIYRAIGNSTSGTNGPIAQRSEPPAHNRSVPGSNPGGPTICENERVIGRKTRMSLEHEKRSTVYKPR